MHHRLNMGYTIKAQVLVYIYFKFILFIYLFIFVCFGTVKPSVKGAQA
jgi:hypothetical protein